ncbi:MAG TPA: mannanase [Sphingomicrobium sp.]|nr:mannanase [Sphingomicrobium sp.]
MAARITRRDLLVGASALLGSSVATTSPIGAPVPARGFVRREGSRLILDGEPWRYVGTNMWYAAYLGADAAYGNRDRLRRELDRVAGLGIRSIRILGSSEMSPLLHSVKPTFRDETNRYNETLLRGLDFALAEMGKRGLKAVIYLANFWEWSGGFMTYLYWTNGGRYINMNDPAHPWPEFPDMSSDFYGSPKAVAMLRDYVRAVVTRRNTISGLRYSDDPAIQSWQLANEPRPGETPEIVARHMPAYLAWIDGTAKYIKSLDPNHMVSTGSEGTQGCATSDSCARDAHASPAIDYMTAHIWPQNWSWADPKDLPGTWPTVEKNTRDYFARQAAIAAALGKPIVVEEFGFPRDNGSFDPGTPTTYKDRFYSLIYELAEESMRAGGPVAGTHFWAWSGEGRAQHPDHRFQDGDTNYVGDPPHEPQGWYGVFDVDASTQAVIRSHAAAVAALGSARPGERG